MGKELRMMKKLGKAAILVCLIVAFAAFSLTGCGNTVKPGDTVTLEPDAGQEQLQKLLQTEGNIGIVLSGDIVLTAPVEIVGDKTVTGTGTLKAGEDLQGEYLITVPGEAKLTLGENVTVDAANVCGGVFVAPQGVLAIQDQAAVKNASAATANVMVEGFMDLLGGSLTGAAGINVHNKGEITIAGGEIRGSGNDCAGIYNEGTLSQNGGSVAGAYNNIVTAEGSSFTWTDGTNTDARNNGIVVAESAQLKITSRSAKLSGAANLGIDLRGTAVIDDASISDCVNTLVRVASTGNLTLNGGMIYNGSFHGVDNDGVMLMTGGDIMSCGDCGIVNTGSLQVTGGGISENGNKGILNKLEGKASVIGEDVILSGNRFAIGNDDKATFELAKATLMMSTTTNIYALDGQMYIHDIELGASSSNNIRVVNAELKLENVTVNGNASTGSRSMHGIILEGGVVNAKNLVVRNTTGAGIRNKGGVFTGDNVTLTKNAYIGIYTSNQDVTDLPSTTVITNLTVSEQGYMSISSNGTSLLEITNAVFDPTPSNNIRADGGTVKLTNVKVLGHTEAATTAHHGIFLEGGEIIAKDLEVSNTRGHGLRNKSGDFTGTNVSFSNINGDSAVSNVMLADGTSGSITLNNVSFSNVKSKNVVSEAGVITINGSYMAPTPASNIKITGGVVVLNDVTVAGNIPVGNDAYHAIIIEKGYGALHMNSVVLCDAKDSGIRNKTGVVKGTDVVIKNCGTSAISNGLDMTYNLAGKTTIDGLTVINCGSNNIVAEGGEVHVTNADLGESKSNNVKTSGDAVITLTDSVVKGSQTSYGVISEGGQIVLTNVTIENVKTSGIRVNKVNSHVTGTNVTIRNTGDHGIMADRGIVEIDGLVTENIGQRNIQVGANADAANGIAASGGTVRISNATLCKTENQHSVVSYGENMGTVLELTNVVLNGSGNGGGSRHVLLAEGGNMKLTDVTIKDANNAALRVNRAASAVEADNLTIEGGLYGISASAGSITVRNLKSTAKDRNIAAEGATIVVDGATLGNTSTHNIKINKGSLTLKNATMEGSANRGIMVEPGASDGQPVVDLENVTLSNISSRALENRGGIVTATNLTVNGSKDHAIQNQLHKDGTTAGTITVTNLTVSGAPRSINNDNGTVTVIGGNLGVTSGHNVKAAAGTVSLTDVVIEGTTSNAGVMAEGGNVNLTNVTIRNTTTSGVRINRAESTVTANNLTVQGAKDCGIFASAGTVNVTTYIASGNNRNIDVSGANVTVSNASLGGTTTHNVKTSAGTLTLTNVAIQGSATYGVICEGGTITATDLVVKNTVSAALRVNKANGAVTVNNLTVEGCVNAIKSSAGSMVIDNMTANTTAANVIAEGAAITLRGANLSNNGTANVVEHTAGTLNLTNVQTSVPAEGFHSIHNTAAGLNLSGTIAGEVFNAGAVPFHVMGALEAPLVVSWAEGSAPAGAAITFAEGTMEGAQEKITLSGFYATDYKLVYADNAATLAEKAVYILRIGTERFETVDAALAYLAQQSGDVTLTALADTAITQAVTVPAGMNLTLAAAEGKHLGATVVMNGGKLTIEKDVTLTGLNVVAGGQVVYNGNTATAEAPLTVTVNGLPYEQVLTVAENNGATAECFTLVDANGNVYGGELAEGVLSVYTRSITDQATLDAGIASAPDGKIGYLVLKADITMDAQSTVTAGKVLIMTDDGTARKLIRGTTTGTMLKVNAGAKLTVRSSSAAELITFDGGKLEDKKGSGMVNTQGELIMQFVGIVNNQWNANNRGLGLYANSGSVVTLNNVRFDNINNTYGAKGWAMIVNGSTVTMNNCSVTNCSGKAQGTIEVTNGSLTANNTVFSGNSAKYGGAIYVANNANSRLTLDGCLFENNSAIEGSNGGAINSDFNNPAVVAVVIRNSTFRNNSAAAEGGAISVATGGCLDISNTVFEGNTAAKFNSGEPDTKVWGNDIRLGGATNVVTLSGMVKVTIFHNQIAVVRINGALAAGSDVKLDGRPLKYTAASYDVFDFGSEEVMNASKAYISLGTNLVDVGKTLVFEGGKAKLQNIPVVSTQAELEQALANAANIPVIKLAANTTISVQNITFPATPVTIQGQTGSVIKYAGTTKDAAVMTFPENSNITFRNVTVDCNNVGVFQIPANANVTLENSTVTNAKGVTNRSVHVLGNLNLRGIVTIDGANWALGVQKSGVVTSEPGSKLVLKNATYGITTHDSSNVHIVDVESSNVSNSALYNDGSSVMVVDKASLGASASGKNTVNVLKGTLTLSNATITNPGNYAVIQKNGVLNLNNVTALNAPGWSVCVDGANAVLKATDLTISGSKGTCLQIQNGTADVTNLVTTNMASSHSVKVVAGTLNITGMNLGVSNSNNLNIAGGEVNLHGTCTITGAKSNYGIRIDAAGTVNVHSDCVLSIANVAKKGIVGYGGKLNLAGTVNATIEFEGTGSNNRVLNITDALGAGSNVNVDWIGDDDHPAGNAITFASADVLNASKDFITLGANRGAAYELTFGETAATLTPKQ